MHSNWDTYRPEMLRARGGTNASGVWADRRATLPVRGVA